MRVLCVRAGDARRAFSYDYRRAPQAEPDGQLRRAHRRNVHLGSECRAVRREPAWQGDEHEAIVKIHVAKNGRYLHALAADGSIVFHFPTTVGSEYDPSPSGVYRVSRVQWHPVFHYDPSLYSDVPDSRPRATLPPGPNSPVGIVWIATTKEHVGIHGTPLPHTIGLASSHGCVRLANWDAARLAAAVHAGVTIEFVN